MVVRKNRDIITVDRDFIPMQIVDRVHGITAVSSGRALILDPKTWRTYSVLDYPNWPPIHVIQYPHVKAIKDARLNPGSGGVLKRDNHECQYKGCERKGTTLDHVIPRCQGGPSTWNNLVACCPICNSKKAGRTPQQAGMELKHPIRSPKWLLYEKFNTLCGGWSKRDE